MSIWNIASLMAEGKENNVNQVTALKGLSLQRNMALPKEVTWSVTSEATCKGCKFTAEKRTNFSKQNIFN